METTNAYDKHCFLQLPQQQQCTHNTTQHRGYPQHRTPTHKATHTDLRQAHTQCTTQQLFFSASKAASEAQATHRDACIECTSPLMSRHSNTASQLTQQAQHLLRRACCCCVRCCCHCCHCCRHCCRSSRRLEGVVLQQLSREAVTRLGVQQLRLTLQKVTPGHTTSHLFRTEVTPFQGRCHTFFKAGVTPFRGGGHTNPGCVR
jgi:hypothetical protein